MEFEYRGKLVLITGASSGLGRCLVQAFAGAGAHLALAARREDALSRAADLVREAGGLEARIFPCDLSDPEAVSGLIRQVEGGFGRAVDVIVHCAGMSCYGEIERVPFAEIRRLTDLNYLAGVRLVQCVAGSMKIRGSGQIIWIGSGSAFRGIPRAAVYCASKAAAKAFCEAVRGELADFGVDVLFVIPGAMQTEFHGSQKNFASDGRLRSTGGPAAPEAVAAAVLRAGRLRRPALIYSGTTRAVKHLSYWAPWFLDRLLRWQIKT